MSNAVTCIYHASGSSNWYEDIDEPDLIHNMVKFGCVPPLVKILTKQNLGSAIIMEALHSIDYILAFVTGEDMKNSFVPAMEKDGSMDAIVKLQVLCSFDCSSCFFCNSKRNIVCRSVTPRK